MKKFIAFFAIVLVASSIAFAQQIEHIEEKQKEKLAVIKIDYIPELDEAQMTYSCPAGLYDERDAVRALKERAQIFTREKNYYFYTYQRKDVTHYDNEKKLAHHTSYIKFLN